MTIIVGIICEDTIVIASDSQTTAGNAKRCDTEKIVAVEFANGEVMVAQSGCATYSSRAIEIFTDLARSVTITNYRTVTELAEQAMRQLRNEIRLQRNDCTMEELQEYVWRHELGCEFMIAYYFERKPYLYTLDMMMGIADKVSSRYTAIGCGASLGTYLLEDFMPHQAGYSHSTAIAVCVVEIVKKHDAYCGGPTKVGIAYQFGSIGNPDSKFSLVYKMPSSEVDELSGIALNAYEMARYERSLKVLEKLIEKSERFTAKVDSELRNATIPPLESRGDKPS